MSKRWLKRTLWIGLAGGLVFLGITMWLLRPAHVKSVVESGLSKHLNLDATVETISVSLFPRPRVSGSGFSLKIPGRPDLPPFVAIDRFAMEVGLLSMVRKHVDTVRADGLRINVPPSDSRKALPETRGSEKTEIIIDHFLTRDAQLSFVPRETGRTPLTFAIHELEVEDIGFGLSMPFTATLTNPVPRGLVRARGAIGPIVETNAEATPVAGDYTFENADLSTINGIGGMLQSTGKFSGPLTAIAASGEATVPDFSLDLGGKPAPLTARFETLVNGTDGTTELKKVDATLHQTDMTVTGAISNLEGPGRHDVDLSIDIPDGRIEDVLSLVLDTPQPVMSGDVTIKAHMKLPPGESRVRDRIEVSGDFGLTQTRFTNAEVQAKLQTLSRRSQGKDEDDPIGRVLTDLKGQVQLSKGNARLRRLTFQVPGARVALDGTYSLASGALDFRGTLRMQATVSQAVGGFKSIFIKPFNGLFRKNGAGAELPIKITGTRDEPKFGLEIGKVFKGD